MAEKKNETEKEQPKSKKPTLKQKLKEEEALHFFVRNRAANGMDSTSIQQEWLPVLEKIRKNPKYADQIYEYEKLISLTAITRQLLGYSNEGISKKVEEVAQEYNG